MNDLMGKKFNRLLVVGKIHRRNNKGISLLLWECQCDCGNPKHSFVRGNDLTRGHIKSCGCLQREKASGMRSTPNNYDLSGEYGIGYTSKGDEFWFDLEDYDLIKKYHWYTSTNYPHYILSWNENRKKITLHGTIMGITNVDHIGGSTTVHDNRKSNLRTYGNNKSEFQSRNTWNAKLKSNNTSGTTGVHWDHGKWCARITVNGERIVLGRFDDINDAIKARKDAEEKYCKEWSKDNSVEYYQNNFGDGTDVIIDMSK